MTLKLFFNAIIKLILGVVLVGVFIFLPAGTLNYYCGWLLMGILFIPMFIAGLIMMAKNPELLKKRLSAKEKQSEQGIVLKLSGLMFVCGFVLAGLDYRFAWFTIPFEISLIGAVLFLFAYVMYAEVLRENTYLSRTIEIQEGQKVVSTGLYGVVRHPMYSATLLLFISMPIVLGSVIALIPFIAYPFIIAMRIKYEEKMLVNELDGYKEYTEKVKYRLIPFIW